MKKLSRKKQHRENMLTNLASSIIIYEKVTTTDTKAKQARSIVEKAINIAKKSTLTSHKQLLAMFMHNKNVVLKLEKDLSKRFADTKSGFVKLYKVKPRVGDNAPRTTIILKKSKFLNNISPIVDEKSTSKDKKDNNLDK